MEVGGIPIEVSRKRVKNINLRVGEGGSVRMSVPERTSRASAEACARDHLAWIRSSRERVLAREANAAHGYSEGELLPLWGTPRTIRLEESDGDPSCKLRGPEVVISGPADLLDQSPEAVEARGRLVAGLLEAELGRRLPDVLGECEREVGRSASSVSLRRMKTRWGSCTPSTGRIRLNVSLAEHDPSCLRMVCIHELCHLIEPNHGARFYRLMDAHCPGWRAAQAELDRADPEKFY